MDPPAHHAADRDSSRRAGDRHRQGRQTHCTADPQPSRPEFSVAFAVIPLVRFTQRAREDGGIRQFASHHRHCLGCDRCHTFFNAELLWLTFRFY
jgi:hypothetical protein